MLFSLSIRATSALQMAPTVALSTYGMYLAYQNITRLRQYEEKSEKAAEWSNTAAQKLYKTRTTQASGTIALLSSLVTSSMLLLIPSLKSPSLLISAGVANSIAAYLAHVHMAGFWNERAQTKIPFVEKFNEAIRGSEQVVVLLKTLSLAWGAAAAVWMGMANGGSGLLGLAVWGLVVGGRLGAVAEQMGWKEVKRA